MVGEEVGEPRRDLRNPRRKPETWDLKSSLAWIILFYMRLLPLALRLEAPGM